MGVPVGLRLLLLGVLSATAASAAARASEAVDTPMQNAAPLGWLAGAGPAIALGSREPWSDTNTPNCRWMCPTVIKYPREWALWALVFMYVAAAAGAVAVLCRGNAKRFAFRNNYLLLQIFFCLVRAFFFTVHVEMGLMVLLIVRLAIPLYLQFVTFSLLLVFLIKCLLVMQGRPKLVPSVLYPAYTLFIISLGIGTGIIAYIKGADLEKGTPASHRRSGTIDHGFAFWAGFLFGSLAVLVGVVGLATYRMLMKIILSERRRRKVQGISGLIILYFVVFFGRATWAITFSVHFNPAEWHIQYVVQHEQWREYYIILAAFYFVFEIVPIVGLLRTFWKWAPQSGRDLMDGAEVYSKRKNHHQINDDPTRPLLGSH